MLEGFRLRSLTFCRYLRIVLVLTTARKITKLEKSSVIDLTPSLPIYTVQHSFEALIMSTANTTAWPNFGLYNLPPDSEGLVMVRLNIFLITFSTILLFGRLYVRAFMVKVLGLDDLLASISWCVLVSLSSMEIVTVGLGSGTHLVDVPLNLIPKFFSVSSPETRLSKEWES